MRKFIGASLTVLLVAAVTFAVMFEVTLMRKCYAYNDADLMACYMLHGRCMGSGGRID